MTELARVLAKLDSIEASIGTINVAVARLDAHAEMRNATLEEVRRDLASKASREELDALKNNLGRIVWLAITGFLTALGSALWKFFGGTTP